MAEHPSWTPRLRSAVSEGWFEERTRFALFTYGNASKVIRAGMKDAVDETARDELALWLVGTLPSLEPWFAEHRCRWVVATPGHNPSDGSRSMTGWMAELIAANTSLEYLKGALVRTEQVPSFYRTGTRPGLERHIETLRWAGGPGPRHGEAILIFDDQFTIGHTATACAQVASAATGATVLGLYLSRSRAPFQLDNPVIKRADRLPSAKLTANPADAPLALEPATPPTGSPPTRSQRAATPPIVVRRVPSPPMPKSTPVRRASPPPSQARPTVAQTRPPETQAGPPAASREPPVMMEAGGTARADSSMAAVPISPPTPAGSAVPSIRATRSDRPRSRWLALVAALAVFGIVGSAIVVLPTLDADATASLDGSVAAASPVPVPSPPDMASATLDGMTGLSTSPSHPAARATPQPGSGSFAPREMATLAARIPSGLIASCAPASRSIPRRAIAGYRCALSDEQSTVLEFYLFDRRAELGRAFWSDLEAVGIRRRDEGQACEPGALRQWSTWHRDSGEGMGGELACAAGGGSARLFVTDHEHRVLTRARRTARSPASLAAWWESGALDLCRDAAC